MSESWVWWLIPIHFYGKLHVFEWKNVLFVALLSQKRAWFGIFFITDSESAHFKSPYIKFWGGFDRKFYHDPNPLKTWTSLSAMFHNNVYHINSLKLIDYQYECHYFNVLFFVSSVSLFNRICLVHKLWMKVQISFTCLSCKGQIFQSRK